MRNCSSMADVRKLAKMFGSIRESAIERLQVLDDKEAKTNMIFCDSGLGKQSCCSSRRLPNWDSACGSFGVQLP